MDYVIISPPAHGTASITDDIATYIPDNGYSGSDSFIYEASYDGDVMHTRRVCVDVRFVEGPKSWRPISPSCVLDDGNRTGYQQWATLEQYDTHNNTPTGNTKPNVPGDPNYVPPAYNPAECPPQTTLVVNNTDTDRDDPFRLFVDADVVVLVNGLFVANIRDTGQFTFPVNIGDTVNLTQTTNPINNPWPPASSFGFDVTKGSNSLYSNSGTSQVSPLSEFEFDITETGNYIVDSLAQSTASGFRKYRCKTVIIPPGITDIMGLTVEITDKSDSQIVAIKGTYDEDSSDSDTEFNVINDSGNISIRILNASGSNWEVTLTNQSSSFTYTQSIGNGFNHTFPDVPKGDFIISADLD